jgi:hypothetical protein
VLVVPELLRPPSLLIRQLGPVLVERPGVHEYWPIRLWGRLRFGLNFWLELGLRLALRLGFRLRLRSNLLRLLHKLLRACVAEFRQPILQRAHITAVVRRAKPAGPDLLPEAVLQ